MQVMKNTSPNIQVQNRDVSGPTKKDYILNINGILHISDELKMKENGFLTTFKNYLYVTNSGGDEGLNATFIGGANFWKIQAKRICQ